MTTKILSTANMVSAAQRMLEDAIEESYLGRPSKSLFFNTGDGTYECYCYKTGWTIRRTDGDTNVTLLKDVPEDVMWSTLKVLK